MSRSARSNNVAVSICVIACTIGQAVPRAQEPAPDSGVTRLIQASQQAAGATTTRRDSLVNGTLIGAAVGFGAGFFSFAAYNAKQTDSGPIWNGEGMGYYTGAGIIGAGIGALVGAIVDASRTRRQRSPGTRPFVAVVPVGQPHRRAVYVSISY